MVKILSIFLILFFNQVCYALPEDRQQIIHFSAGSADINQETHLGTYQDNVSMDQGSTHIRATKAVTEGDANNHLIKATIFGSRTSQAHYWTLTAINKPELHAYADIINYYPEKHLIELIGHARVEQGNNSFQAPSISYDTESQHVISKQINNERTIITIHPEKHA